MALVGIDAQTAFDNKYKAQKSTEKKLEEKGNTLANKDKWDGKLVIDGYAFEEVNLAKHLIDELIIRDCPNLKKININDNEFVKVDLSEMKLDPVSKKPVASVLEEFYASNNQLTDLNLKNCKEIKKLKLSKNKDLKKAKGLEDSENLNEIDLTGSPHFRLLLADKLTGYQKAKDVVKELFETPDGKLPDSAKTNGILDKNKAKNELESKIVSDKSPQLQADKESAESQRDAAKAELESIKTERDQLKQQLAGIIKELKLNESATDKQVLDKIKELMNRPTSGCPHTDYDSIKTERDNLKTDNENKKRKITELESDKENIITKKIMVKKTGELFNTLDFSNTKASEINNANSAERVEEIRSEVIREEFGRLKDENNSSFYLNIGLGGILIITLILLGWLIMKQNDLPKIEAKKEKK